VQVELRSPTTDEESAIGESESSFPTSIARAQPKCDPAEHLIELPPTPHLHLPNLTAATEQFTYSSANTAPTS
jgi:hypothetical protein